MDRYAIWRSRTALTGFLTKNSTGGTVGRLKLGKARLSCYDQRMFLDAQAGTATLSDAPMAGPLRSKIPSHTCFLSYHPKCIPTDLKCHRRIPGESYESREIFRSPLALTSQLATVKLSKQRSGRWILPPGCDKSSLLLPSLEKIQILSFSPSLTSAKAKRTFNPTVCLFIYFQMKILF